MKLYNVTIQMKASGKCKEVLKFCVCVDKMLKENRSNESFQAVLCFDAVYF